MVETLWCKGQELNRLLSGARTAVIRAANETMIGLTRGFHWQIQIQGGVPRDRSTPYRVIGT